MQKISNTINYVQFDKEIESFSHRANASITEAEKIEKLNKYFVKRRRNDLEEKKLAVYRLLSGSKIVCN